MILTDLAFETSEINWGSDWGPTVVDTGLLSLMNINRVLNIEAGIISDDQVHVMPLRWGDEEQISAILQKVNAKIPTRGTPFTQDLAQALSLPSGERKSCSTEQLDESCVEQESLTTYPEVLLGSDIVYDRRGWIPLIQTFFSLANTKTQILLASGVHNGTLQEFLDFASGVTSNHSGMYKAEETESGGASNQRIQGRFLKKVVVPSFSGKQEISIAELRLLESKVQ